MFDKRLGVKLTSDINTKLEKISKDMGTTKSNVVRMSIALFLKKFGGEVNE